MSKTVYDEAIADAKLLRETAEQNAKNAIIEAVTPRIRTFIEEQLIGNSSEGGSSDVLDDVIKWLNIDNNRIAIYDGTNSTTNRRKNKYI